MVRLFESGDRVRVRASRPVRAGTVGRVIGILMGSPDIYFVQFDGFVYSWVMRADELELVTDAPVDEDAS